MLLCIFLRALAIVVGVLVMYVLFMLIDYHFEDEEIQAEFRAFVTMVFLIFLFLFIGGN